MDVIFIAINDMDCAIFKYSFPGLKELSLQYIRIFIWFPVVIFKDKEGKHIILERIKNL